MGNTGKVTKPKLTIQGFIPHIFSSFSFITEEAHAFHFAGNISLGTYESSPGFSKRLER